ncbi:MAG: hypothetical protein IPL27_25835 [Lewinellaceae bacterium]|nr:hypothetical protein [Lewinellaceae bacterium]
MLDARLPMQLLDSLTVMPPLLSVTLIPHSSSLIPHSSSLIPDSSSLIPRSSSLIPHPSLDSGIFSLKNNQLYTDTARLRAICPDCEEVKVVYRVLPYDFAAPLRRLDTLAIRRNARTDAIEFDYAPYEPATKPWETNGLLSSGAYTRGLSFGNNQNLVFNSSLNLQLSGKLGNDLELQASLSDNSVPLQPDGTTRQLQEFDRIFIQLKRKNTALTAGDYDLTRPAGYFSNYFKRLQGAMVEHRQIGNWGFGSKTSGDTLAVRVAAAVSRGKFARQIIQGQEGNQGPYRLQGAEGERFIIVLAGTEKVFIDGQLLRRGLSDDYVMDYNLGELTFTSRKLITKDSRVIVEFEYAVQTYLRSTVAANLAWSAPHSRIYLNYYAEQDSRNNGGAQDLSATERRSLAEIGDNLRMAFASGVDTLDVFDPARVQYRVVDSLVCGVPIQILEYSTRPDSARFTARFTEVLQGQGNYVLALTAANGRVYRWVAPDPLTCQPTGNFEPVVRLIAPESRQLYTLGGDFQVSKGGNVQAELALSNRDLNRYSPLGNGDNLGGAGFLGFRQKIPLGNEQKGWQAGVYANYEYTARTFLPLNPYRPAEFIRDWNSSGSLDTVAEQIARGGISMKKKDWGESRYEFGSFRRQGVYEGYRHFGQLRVQQRGYELLGELNFLQTEGRVESTRFARPKIDFSKTFFRKDSTLRQAFVKTGVYFEREKNERNATDADSLNRASFWYDLLRLYFQTPDNQDNKWQLGGFLSRRNDFAPNGSFFKQNTEANELNLNGKWQKSGLKIAANQQINWNFTYRTLRVLAPELTTEKPLETYLGRVDYSLAAWRNALNFTTGYELGSGQSPKLEFNYLSVNPGEGQYTWVDRNRDSILQVDEMEIAVFQDQASYIRVAVSTPDYIRTNNVLLNQNLRLDPRMVWGTAPKGWRRTLSRFSTQSTLQINRRTFAGAEDISPWNPFQFNIADTALVTVAATLRNILFVNRANPAWDASLAQGDNRSQVALTTGFEQRRARDWTLHGRVNLSLRWSAEADLIRAEKSTDNQAFDNRDFDINTWEAGPKLTWLPNRTFRIASNVKWKDSQNAIGEMEKAAQINWNTELTWNPQSKQNVQGFRAATSLRAKFTLADIKYTGQANTSVAFTMLEGLQDGKNYLWSLNLDRQLSKTVQMSLNYEGRKTGDNRVVHVGRAQVRAVF